MDYSKIYNEMLQTVESRLKVIIPDKEPISLYEPFKYLVLSGGKRIRPILSMICSGAVGGNPDNALDIGIAIEILHNFTLAHDDIMDASPLRRGRETIHTKWNEATAILTGDLMIGWAYSLLLNKNNTSLSVLNEFTKGLIEVCEGQAMDMELENSNTVVLADYLKMIDKKTAKILETCAVTGAIAGNGNEKQIEKLRSFANNLGIAFQIKDDLLDLLAEQSKLGKTVGQDIIDGKRTCLIILANEKASSKKHKDLLQKFFDEKGLNHTYVNEVRILMEELGVIKDADDLSNKYFNYALSDLDSFDENLYVGMLKWLAEKLNKRTY